MRRAPGAAAPQKQADGGGIGASGATRRAADDCGAGEKQRRAKAPRLAGQLWAGPAAHGGPAAGVGFQDGGGGGGGVDSNLLRGYAQGWAAAAGPWGAPPPIAAQWPPPPPPPIWPLGSPQPAGHALLSAPAGAGALPCWLGYGGGGGGDSGGELWSSPPVRPCGGSQHVGKEARRGGGGGGDYGGGGGGGGGGRVGGAGEGAGCCQRGGAYAHSLTVCGCRSAPRRCRWSLIGRERVPVGSGPARPTRRGAPLTPLPDCGGRGTRLSLSPPSLGLGEGGVSAPVLDRARSEYKRYFEHTHTCTEY